MRPPRLSARLSDCTPSFLPLSLLLALVLLLSSCVASSAQGPAWSDLAPVDAESPGWTLAPVLRCPNRTAALPMQWLVQTDSNATTTTVMGALPGVLAALTSTMPGSSSSPLPFGVFLSATVMFVYERALTGFALKFKVRVMTGSDLSDAFTLDNVVEAGAAAVAQMRGVLLLEEDARVHATIESQELQSSGAQWSLDRVDQRPRVGDNRYYYNRTGAGSHVYVLDTGIRITHAEFEGRADWSFSAFDRSEPAQADDLHGHGTHVAGTVGGRTFGVAKGALLHAVRVLDAEGAGSDSGVAAGLDWVAKYASTPAVVVMSLGGPASSTLDSAVRNLVARGISVVVAAGNSNSNACDSSPARVDVAVTVASSDEADARSAFSNHGSCVTMFAPGSRVLSASHENDSASRLMSGTSMSAPHVAGAVALYLSKHPSASPAAVKSDLVCYATKDALRDPKGAPNRLLYTIIGRSGSARMPPHEVGAAVVPGTSELSHTQNSEHEQCTSASPCVGPLSATLERTGSIARFLFNTTGVAGFHRAWLSYHTGGGTLLEPRRVRNDLALLRWDSASAAWVVVASATDSSSHKQVVHENVAGAPASWAWLVRARADAPSDIRLTYKVPSAAMLNQPNPPPGTDICSATPSYDPDPTTPNNPGQDPLAGSQSAATLSFSAPLLPALAMAAGALWLHL